MTARAGEAAAELLGCFPGAVVARGPDWRFGDQDGGPGARGVVREVRRFCEGVKYFLDERSNFPRCTTGAPLRGPRASPPPGAWSAWCGQTGEMLLSAVRSYNIFKFAQ